MYKTQKVFVRSQHPHWSLIEHEGVLVSDVLRNNINILIEFANIEYPDEVKHIDISKERHWMRFQDVDFDTLLNDNDIQSLIKEGALYLYEQKVLSGELDVLNFDYQLSSIGYQIDSTIPDSMKKDLFVTRENTDLDQVAAQTIFTVNGMCHPSNRNSNGITVRGAGETLKHSGEDSLGLISFRSLGNITQHNITRSSLLFTEPEEGLFKNLALNFPDADLVNHTPFLVWCGKLLMPGQGWEVIGSNSIRIYPERLGWVDRIHEHKEWINFDSLLLTEHTFNKSLISKAQLKQDITIIRALELTQTFLFTVNVNGLTYLEHPIQYESPGRFLTMKKLDYPLRLHDGRYPAYMKHDEDQFRALTIPYKPRLRYKHDSWYDDHIDLMDDSLDTYDMELNASATLIEISRKTPMTKAEIEAERRRTGVAVDAGSVVPDTTECDDNIDYVMTSMENAVEAAIVNYTRNDDDTTQPSN